MAESGRVTIPTLVHLMVNEDPRFNDNNSQVLEVADLLPGLLAGEGSPLYQKSVNFIWKVADVAFSLAGHDTCPYTAKDIHAEDNEVPGECHPAEQDPALFRALQRKFGHAGFRGLQVYVWWNLQAGGGCGLANRRPAPHGRLGGESSPGAVFLEAIALVGELADRPNELLMAHEIGHFLGLLHPDPPVDSASKRLMHPGFPGPILTQGEVHDAKTEAQRLMATT